MSGKSFVQTNQTLFDLRKSESTPKIFTITLQSIDTLSDDLFLY